MLYTSASGKQVIGKEIDMSMQLSGIYALINKVNLKLYVGKSINVYERTLEHFNCLNNNKHVNTHLQSSFNKYEGQFAAILLEECECSLLDDREKFYISYYETYNYVQPSKGYNLTLGGDGILGYKVNDETKKQISKNLKGIKRSEETKKKMSDSRKKIGVHPETRRKQIEIESIPIVQITFDRVVTYWKSAAEATRELGFSSSSGIRNCCLKKQKYYKNSYWFNLTEYESTSFILPMIKKRGKIIVQLDKNLNIVKVWNNAKEASELGGFTAICISKCCKKQSITHNDYIWMYYEEYQSKYNSIDLRELLN